ncbi:MAG: PAS domain-containing protein [Pseudomonadales bacterium]|nr:PAS domain-containing protein [Pseudomonadales bacterium]
MQQTKPREFIFSRLIFGYATIGLVIVLAALFSINRIENQISAAPIIYEQALFKLRKIESLSNDAAQELFAYLLSGLEEDLMDYRKVVEILPSNFDSFALLAMLSSPEEASQLAQFSAIKRSWGSFTSNAEVLIEAYERKGEVSSANVIAVEKTLDDYQELLNLLLEYEHHQAQDARIQLSQIVRNSQLLFLIAACVGLVGLAIVGVLVTREVNRLVSMRRRGGAALNLAQVESERIAAELTQFIDTANAPIFGIDADGLINEWNQTAAKITGFEKEDVLGQDLVQGFITEEYRESVKAVLDNALKGVESSNYEFPLYTKNGARVEVLLNATTRLDVDGNIIGVIGVGQDITDAKVAQVALQQAQKMEVIGQLTGGVAHDFNNLLAVISGNLEFLQGELGVVPADVTEIIDDARAAARDGAELTHRLLAFARRQSLEPKETYINGLIADTCRLISRTLGEGIKITTALDRKNPMVMVDKVQLESALMNLSINARDAMPSGGSLTITSETKSFDHVLTQRVDGLAVGKYAVITVEDSGSGMSENEVAHAFEPFYTTKESGKGSGLGLSMVHGFVTQSNGTVVIESKLGSGSKVTLYLPDITNDRNALVPPVNPTLSTIAPAGIEKILVVDDESLVRKTAVRVLRKLGYEVIKANSGEEALVLMRKNKDIDLMFSDILMPGGMSGRQLASIVNKEYPKIKIQLTSGYDNVEATKDNADFPLLKKPYDLQKLATALRKLLD